MRLGPREARSAKRVAGGGCDRHGRDPVETDFLDTSQLGLHCLRYIAAGEIAEAWGDPGGMGAALTDLAHLLEPPVGRNLRAESCAGRAPRTAWARLSRKRGNVETINGEIAQVNRDRLYQCIADRKVGFSESS